MTPDLTMFGYPARLTIDLPDGPHDISGCIETVTIGDVPAPRSGFYIDASRLLSEIQIEKRARERSTEAT